VKTLKDTKSMDHIHIQCAAIINLPDTDNAEKMYHAIKAFKGCQDLPKEFSLSHSNPWQIVIPAVLHQLPSILDLFKGVRFQDQMADKGFTGNKPASFPTSPKRRTG
jgi:hypothetical protein